MGDEFFSCEGSCIVLYQRRKIMLKMMFCPESAFRSQRNRCARTPKMEPKWIHFHKKIRIAMFHLRGFVMREPITCLSSQIIKFVAEATEKVVIIHVSWYVNNQPTFHLYLVLKTPRLFPLHSTNSCMYIGGATKFPPPVCRTTSYSPWSTLHPWYSNFWGRTLLSGHHHVLACFSVAALRGGCNGANTEVH